MCWHIILKMMFSNFARLGEYSGIQKFGFIFIVFGFDSDKTLNWSRIKVMKLFNPTKTPKISFKGCSCEVNTKILNIIFH